VADLGIIHIMLIWRHAENKSYELMEASTQISKEGQESKAMCERVRIPAGSP
jgi:hypothetical protein